MDLVASKKSLLLNIVIPLFYPAFFRTHGSLDVLSYLFCISLCGFLLFNGFAEMDEKYKTGILLNTLPVNRAEIVTSRFISMYVVYGSATLLYLASAAVLHLVMPQSYGIFDMNAIPAGLLVASLVNAIQIPLYYVLDLQKSRTAGIFLMFGTIGLYAYLSEMSWVKNSVLSFTRMNVAMRSCVFLIFAAIIFTSACIITEKIYQRREF